MKKIKNNNKIILYCLMISNILYGCQLPLANYVRDHTFPEDTTSKIALSPILLPTYAVLSVTDIVIINPVRGCKNIPDTVNSIWKWQNEDAWIGKGVLLPFKLIATPITAIGTTIFSEQFIYTKTTE